MPMEEDDFLGINTTDKWARRFAVGVPLVGSLFGTLGSIAGTLLGEYLSSTLPNQRMDRFVEYFSHLNSTFSKEKIEEILRISDKVNLLEEGMYAVGFTPHKDRRQRISNAVSAGLNKDDFELDKESHLLGIIRNISDVDFIVLNYYKIRDEFNEKLIIDYEEKYPEIFPRKSQVGENPKIQYEIKFNLEGRKRYLSSLGLLFVLPTNINRPNPKMVGLNSSEDLRKYELDIIRDQLIALQEPRYGISFLGEEALERMTSR